MAINRIEKWSTVFRWKRCQEPCVVWYATSVPSSSHAFPSQIHSKGRVRGVVVRRWACYPIIAFGISGIPERELSLRKRPLSVWSSKKSTANSSYWRIGNAAWSNGVAVVPFCCQLQLPERAGNQTVSACGLLDPFIDTLPAGRKVLKNARRCCKCTQSATGDHLSVSLIYDHRVNRLSRGAGCSYKSPLGPVVKDSAKSCDCDKHEQTRVNRGKWGKPSNKRLRGLQRLATCY